MRISITIPCRNEVNYIEECIIAIYQCELPEAAEIEVFVVDGMSDDGTRELVQQLMSKYQGLHLIDNFRKLTPFAFNLGIEAGGKVDFVQIVGARHILSKNYLRECIQRLSSDHECWCAGGRIINEYTSEEGELISRAMSTSFGMGIGNFRTLDRSGYTDTVTSPMYPSKVFENIGYFDEALIRNQDDDFNYRVTKGGGKIYFIHEISLKYYVRANTKGLWRQFFQYGYWKVYVNRKHKAITTLRQLVPPGFVFYLLALPFTFFISLKAAAFTSIPLLLYGLLNLIVSGKNAKSLVEIFKLFGIFWILHLSYGFGYLRGILDFLLLRRDPSEKQARLSR